MSRVEASADVDAGRCKSELAWKLVNARLYRLGSCRYGAGSRSFQPVSNGGEIQDFIRFYQIWKCRQGGLNRVKREHNLCVLVGHHVDATMGG